MYDINDVYFAKRAVGQVGNFIDLPEGITNPKIGFDIEKDVAICRDCGERANWIPEKTEYSDAEKKERYAKSQRVQGKITAPIFLLCGRCLWVFIYSSLSIVNFVRQGDQ